MYTQTCPGEGTSRKPDLDTVLQHLDVPDTLKTRYRTEIAALGANHEHVPFLLQVVEALSDSVQGGLRDEDAPTLSDLQGFIARMNLNGRDRDDVVEAIRAAGGELTSVTGERFSPKSAIQFALRGMSEATGEATSLVDDAISTELAAVARLIDSDPLVRLGITSTALTELAERAGVSLDEEGEVVAALTYISDTYSVGAESALRLVEECGIGFHELPDILAAVKEISVLLSDPTGKLASKVRILELEDDGTLPSEQRWLLEHERFTVSGTTLKKMVDQFEDLQSLGAGTLTDNAPLIDAIFFVASRLPEGQTLGQAIELICQEANAQGVFCFRTLMEGAADEDEGEDTPQSEEPDEDEDLMGDDEEPLGVNELELVEPDDTQEY